MRIGNTINDAVSNRICNSTSSVYDALRNCVLNYYYNYYPQHKQWLTMEWRTGVGDTIVSVEYILSTIKIGISICLVQLQDLESIYKENFELWSYLVLWCSSLLIILYQVTISQLLLTCWLKVCMDIIITVIEHLTCVYYKSLVNKLIYIYMRSSQVVGMSVSGSAGRRFKSWWCHLVDA